MPQELNSYRQKGKREIESKHENNRTARSGRITLLGISAMKNIVIFRFIVAAMMVSLGCYALLAHWSGAGIFFSFLPILTMSRSEMTKPIPSRELLIFIVVVLAFAGVVIACKWFVPTSVADDIQSVMRHSAFVLPFWILLLWNLYRFYRRQKGEADA